MTKWKEYPLNRDYLVSDDGQMLGWYRGHRTRRKLKQLVSSGIRKNAIRYGYYWEYA